MIWLFLIITLIIVIWGSITHWKFINNNKQYFNSKHTINNVFDKVYVINLDDQPENLKNMDDQLKKYNIKYSRFKAIVGQDVFDTYKPSEGSWNYEHPGALGCSLSHKGVIEDAVRNNYNKILILEDDCLFRKDFNKFFNKKYQSVINHFPDWKILYFGNSQYLGWPENIKYYDDFYLTKMGHSTFAYGLDKSVFKELLDLLENIDDPIDDILIKEYQEKDLCITILPHIIQQNIEQVSKTSGFSWPLDAYLDDNKVKMEDFV